jgi:hypothetical protein
MYVGDMALDVVYYPYFIGSVSSDIRMLTRVGVSIFWLFNWWFGVSWSHEMLPFLTCVENEK